MNGEYIAVYGTLRKGFYNHMLLGPEPKLLTKGMVQGRIGRNHNENYPRAMPDENSPLAFFVEVYHIKTADAKRIAALESTYDYTPVTVTVNDIKATLWASEFYGPKIPDGVYV